jgi:tyrosyl-DNA phosphodiesterase 1
MKRKAEEELRPQSVKRTPSVSLSMNMPNTRSSGSTSGAKDQVTESDPVLGGADTSRSIARPSGLGSTTEAKAPKRSSAATKEISPPPLRRKIATGRKFAAG